MVKGKLYVHIYYFVQIIIVIVCFCVSIYMFCTIYRFVQSTDSITQSKNSYNAHQSTDWQAFHRMAYLYLRLGFVYRILHSSFWGLGCAKHAQSLQYRSYCDLYSHNTSIAYYYLYYHVPNPKNMNPNPKYGSYTVIMHI